ncbi:MAG: hypothetical protein WC610_00030 [Patescibacteria group bacterium]
MAINLIDCPHCGQKTYGKGKFCSQCAGAIQPPTQPPSQSGPPPATQQGGGQQVASQGKSKWRLDVNPTHDYGDGRYDFRVLLSENGVGTKHDIIVMGIEPDPADPCTGDISPDKKHIVLNQDGGAIVTILVTGRRRDLDFTCPSCGNETKGVLRLHGAYQADPAKGFWGNFKGIIEFNKGR